MHHVKTRGYLRLIAAEAVSPEQMLAVAIEGREILVGRTREGELFALDNTCTHAYARLCEGRLRGHRLICPLHGASYDVRTGAVLGAPATEPLAAHAVRVIDGQIEVSLSD